jgi:hypothetical protein
VSDDPFAALGLTAEAGADDVRAARRELAKQHHPDRGGDPAAMQAINEAAREALRRLDARPVPDEPSSPPSAEPTRRRTPHDPLGGTVSTDTPSFTVEALPVETFEALLVVGSWLGEVLDDDPPYVLELHLHEPLDCWCRLDVVPDAGASTVSLTVAGIGRTPAPDVLAIRDVWIDQLNHLDWT